MPTTPLRRATALVALSLAFGLIQFDATVINTVLDTMRSDLGGNLGLAQWAVDGYTIPFAALMLAAGPAADRFGRRHVCVLGFVLFAAATAGCALSPGWAALISCRVAAGIGAALILPSSLAMIGEVYPEPAVRARALGVWGGVASAGFAAGPPVGGALAAAFGWRSVFWVGVPIALAAGAAVGRTAPSSARREGRLAVRGTALAAAALALGTAAIIEAGQARWVLAAALATVTVLVFVAFVASERGSVPMIPRDMLTPGRFRSAIATGFVFNFALYGALLCVGLGLQSVHGFSVLGTGMAILPMTIVVAFGSTSSGFLTARFGPRIPMVVGFGCAAAGAAGVALGASSPAAVIAGQTAIGLASLAMPAMTSIALAEAPPAHAGLAGAVLNCARQTGGALGVAVLGAAFSACGADAGALAVVFAATAVILVVGIRTSLAATVSRPPEEVPCDVG
ncbi:MFS transporter [Tsukamurella sp. 8F]|uniref:MFS transporter n=1 Tax=unclassified Tsukamurella TaxID=2633480 RepID=UPI0023B97AED|nr:MULTISPECIES: MFS transporter [unclassified Tsukamurella]MDF0528778.1 MFS transporter [Tsukamurella sp. 8J]MDF0586613.1 MFS transporter [Tsukamurella sp. 8F]